MPLEGGGWKEIHLFNYVYGVFQLQNKIEIISRRKKNYFSGKYSGRTIVIKTYNIFSKFINNMVFYFTKINNIILTKLLTWLSSSGH